MNHQNTQTAQNKGTATAAEDSSTTADAMILDEPEVPRDGAGAGAETSSVAGACPRVEGALMVSDDGEVSGGSTEEKKRRHV